MKIETHNIVIIKDGHWQLIMYQDDDDYLIKCTPCNRAYYAYKYAIHYLNCNYSYSYLTKCWMW
jgi:hypothetical protein